MGKNFHLGIDVGGTNIKFAKVYADGTIGEAGKVATPKELAGFLDQIDSVYQQFESGEIESVAMSLPGKVDSEEGVVYFGGSLRYLHRFNFKHHFKETYGKRCTVINDGKAAALCERWLGNLQETENGLVVILGTGVGGGMILNGELYQGNHFQAGELSFMSKNVFDHNVKNIVGYDLSAVNFVEAGAEILGLEPPYDGRIVFDEIKKNSNGELAALFNGYVQKVVNLIVNLQAVLDVEKVLIGGGISDQPILIDEINRQYDRFMEESQLYGMIFEPLVIDTCAFKNNSNILGAVFASKKSENGSVG